MTIHFSDSSEYNYAPPMSPILIARATIGAVKDTKYEQFKILAAQRGQRFCGYAFLNHDSLALTTSSGGPGISAEQQADYAFSTIGGSVPCMLDWESNRGMDATVDMAWRFINRYRGNGGILHLKYLPKWYWEGHIGSPDLRPFEAAGVHLVSSNYTTYSDAGPGWDPYGGIAPVQWQWTNNWLGSGSDGNAYKGTPDQWWAMVTGGKATIMDALSPDQQQDLYRRDKNQDAFAYYGDTLGQEMIPAAQLSYGFPTRSGPAQDQPYALMIKINQILAKVGAAGGLSDADRASLQAVVDSNNAVISSNAALKASVDALNSRLSTP